ncbi:MAG: cation transporter [Candidatus Zixiibacteriota bacterium]
MKKFLLMGLACLALLALVAAPTFACGENGKSASTTTTDGKLVSADGKASCDGAKATSADAKACDAAKGAKMTSADGKASCAAHGSMTSADGAKCTAADGKNCEMVNMSVSGMTCGGCESTVRASLEKIPGVIKVVNVSYKDKVALVCVDPTKCKKDMLTTAVTNNGYEAQIIPAVATSGTDAKADCAAKCAGMDKAACAAKCAAAKDAKAKTPEDSK